MYINNSKEILSFAIETVKQEVTDLQTCFLLTHVPNPRINKRIQVFKEAGSVNVICTRRSSQNIWEPAHKNVEHTIYDIDLPSSRQLIKRTIASMKYQRMAIEKLEEIEPNIIYAEGLDSLIIANKYKRYHVVKIIFEVADLRECFIEYSKNVFKRVQRYLVSREEKKNFKGVDYLILTSPKFFDLHYHKLISRDKMMFIPNAPDAEVFSNYKKKNCGKFTVGFIGGIRYIDQMRMLVDAAESVGCNVLFAGAGGTTDDYKRITEYCKGKEFVTFTGKYYYNEDIAKLYGMVDCVYAVYEADNPNVRIALPNKLYEAVYCELPIIVAKETYLAELVREWGAGFAVSHKDIGELIAILKWLSEELDYYVSLQRKCVLQKNGQGSC